MRSPDQPPTRLPLVLRIALASFPGWWQEHYGADARCTVTDAHSSGAAAWSQAGGLVLGALRARLHGPEALGLAAPPAPLDPFVPSAWWKVARVVGLVVLVAETADVVAAAAWSARKAVAPGLPGELFQGRAIGVDRFDWLDASAWFIALALALGVLLAAIAALLRSRRPSGLVRVACVGTVVLQLVAIGLGLVGAHFAGADNNQNLHFWGAFFATNGRAEFLPPDTVPVVVRGRGPLLAVPLVGLVVLPALLLRSWIVGRWRAAIKATVLVGAVTALAVVGAIGESPSRLATYNLRDAWVGNGFWHIDLAARQPLGQGYDVACVAGDRCLLQASAWAEVNGRLVIANTLAFDSGSPASWRYGRITVGSNAHRALPHSAGDPVTLFGAIPRNDATCVSTRICLASVLVLGGHSPSGAVLRTTDGGSDWSTALLQAGAFGFGALACAPDGGCLVATNPTGGETSCHGCLRGSNGHRELLWSSDAGNTWRPGATLPARFDDVPDFAACADGGTCWIGFGQSVSPTAAGLATVDHGTDLRLVALPWKHLGEVDPVNCQSAGRCELLVMIAGRSSLAVTADHGSTWIARALPHGSPLSGSCGNLLECWFVLTDTSGANTLAVTNDGGRTWRQPLSPSWAAQAVGCADAHFCMALAAPAQLSTGPRSVMEVLVSDDGWRTYRRVDPPLVPQWAVPRLAG